MGKQTLTFLFVLCFAAARGQSHDMVAGTYKGRQPCEECKVIETELELKYGTDTSGEFSLRDKYITGNGGTDITSRMRGDWTMITEKQEGSRLRLVVLDYDNEDKVRYYLWRTDGNLVPLDQNKQPIKADIDCTLRKTE